MAILTRVLGGNGAVDLNSKATLYSVFLVGVIAPEVFIVQPGFVQGLVQYLGFDDQGAGYVASAEMFGLAATTILMTFVAHRVNWRTVVFGSLVVSSFDLQYLLVNMSSYSVNNACAASG